MSRYTGSCEFSFSFGDPKQQVKVLLSYTAIDERGDRQQCREHIIDEAVVDDVLEWGIWVGDYLAPLDLSDIPNRDLKRAAQEAFDAYAGWEAIADACWADYELCAAE
jgi:hypothetical protein